MRDPRAGTIRPIPLFFAAVAVIAIGVALLAKPLFESMSQRARDQEAEKRGAQGLIDAAERVASGGKVDPNMQFPDTSQGRMTRLVYGLIVSEQDRQRKLDDGLQKIGWEWVMSPESLRTPENLRECLKRLAEARKIVRAYGSDLERAWHEMFKRLEAESKSSPEARNFYQGFKDSASKEGGGLYFAKQISRQLEINHEALEASLRFLLDRSGKYTVYDDGEVTFDETVPDKDLETYNELVDRITESMSEIERLDKLHRETSRQRMSQAREYLK